MNPTDDSIVRALVSSIFDRAFPGESCEGEIVSLLLRIRQDALIMGWERAVEALNAMGLQASAAMLATAPENPTDGR